jgi:hypothetical protein
MSGEKYQTGLIKIIKFLLLPMGRNFHSKLTIRKVE